jgi:type IV pilus assembly protein PilW
VNDQTVRVSAAAKRLGGFSLIELMIAVTIGLLVTLVVGNLFVGTKQTFRTQDDTSRMQEDARFALQTLSREIRMAGYWDIPAGIATNIVWKPFGQGGTLNPIDVTNTDAGSINKSDRITVRYFGQSNTAGTAADGTVTDCRGNAARSQDAVVDVFYVAADTANGNVPTLFCDNSANSWTTTNIGPIALVANVESLQVLVGNSTVSGIGRFVPGGTAGFNISDATQLKISLLMRSANAVGAEVNSNAYNHFGESYAPSNAAPSTDLGAVFGAANDRRIRRLFSTTIALHGALG